MLFTGDLIEYIISGLSYSDVAVQLAVTFVCIQLYNKVSRGQCVPDLRTTQGLVRSVMKNLQDTSNGDLLVNLVGTSHNYNNNNNKSGATVLSVVLVIYVSK